MTITSVKLVAICLVLGVVVAFLISVRLFTVNDRTCINCKRDNGLLQKQRPHIVYILVDDLGWGDVGYNGKYHGSAVRTPNIDKLASDGVILDNYYVDSVCTPTRAQLMTGRYAIRYGLQHEVIRPPMPSCLPVDEVTLAEQLQDIGYSTHAVGKWHLGYYKKECLPTNRGFDTFFGAYSSSMDHFSYIKNWTYSENDTGSGFDLRTDTKQHSTSFWHGSGHYSTELLTGATQRVIRKHVRSQSKKPLFIYLPYLTVHEPIQAPERYKDPYKHLIDDELRLTMVGMVNSLDEGIGNVTATLKATGLYDNTIIIVSTDNGGSVQHSGNNWPLRGSKATLFEGGVRGVGFISSPLLPDHAKDTTSHALVYVTDWLPTILSGIAGADIYTKKPIDGFNVWKSVISNMRSPRKEVIHGLDPLPFTYDPNLKGEAALRLGDWKLLMGQPCSNESDVVNNNMACSWYPPNEMNRSTIEPKESLDKKVRLYNIARDPLEMKDMANRRPGIVKRMTQRIMMYNITGIPPYFPSPDPKSNPEYNGGVWGPWE